MKSQKQYFLKFSSIGTWTLIMEENISFSPILERTVCVLSYFFQFNASYQADNEKMIRW